LDLLQTLKAESGISLILISHDLGVVCEMADEVVVLYAGQAVERGGKRSVLFSPAHPYTQGLLRARPSLSDESEDLFVIPGNVPAKRPAGCAFHPRCAHCIPLCRRETPDLSPLGGGHWARCHLLQTGLSGGPAANE
jgi:oligopeptide/dipeptide ABC transporter ATP-binding protein